jgi:hypothetical protein
MANLIGAALAAMYGILLAPVADALAVPKYGKTLNV